jgi:ribosome-associated protein
MDQPSPATPRGVIVRETPIELCQFLKFGGLTSSGGEAKQRIANGEVLVNGALETRKRKKLAAGDTVTLDGETIVVQVGSPG